jgi:site-specific DNA-methyltransferase (adenine-specific)
MEVNKIICGDNVEVMKTFPDDCIDGVITSPPYNTSRTGSADKYDSRYGDYKDNMPNSDYIDWQIDLFKTIETKLKKDGSIIYNINYGSENTETMWLLVADILRKTKLTIADQIIWKKQNALPNNISKNKLTRIIENIFVFVRKDDFKTFNSNKKPTGVIEKTGQKVYENIFNFIEAPNKDRGSHTNNHKATYSTSLCENLINLYYKKGDIILDPFIGTGTTAVACLNTHRKYIGIEISEEYCKIANQRILNAEPQLF